MKRLQKVVALLMLIVLIPLASFANEITEEDTSIVRNPDRGFYKLVQVDLQQGDEDYTRFEKQIISVENEYPDISIISFQLNLKNYTQKTEINKTKIKDINKYIEVIKKYNIKDVVVGSIIKTNGTGEVAPFVKDNSMHTQPIEQEKDIIDSLSKVCKVYTKSIHVLDNFK